MVLLNAAAAFKVAGKVPDIQTGITMAEASIDSGKAREKLDLLIQKTNP
jgi:anthranilate phosphoribosyltransferase